ncbi:MAG: endopeptidase La [Bacilli bacterium]|nr:endopeptidase La [Bacilli bacterium]
MINNIEVATYTMPGIIVKSIVPLPNNEVNIDCISNGNKMAVRQALLSQDKTILLLVQKNFVVENAKPEDLNKICVACKILSSNEASSILKLKVECVVRCELIDILTTTPFFICQVQTKPFISNDLDSEVAALRLVIKELEKIGPAVFRDKPAVLKQISGGITADKLCDILAFNLPLEYNEKLKYLNNPVVPDRLAYILKDIKRELDMKKLENEIEQKVRNNVNENQREYYLREKMRVIQDELGDKVKKETEIEELKKKILECKMPKSIEEKALNELNRYSMYGINSGESGIVRTYLDFLIALPWYKESKNQKDILKAKAQLDKDHYGLERVKSRVLEYLAVTILTKKTPQAILCLAGPPGVGKTSLAKSIATALNKPFVKQSLGGIKDESEIRGHRRTYLGALPGRILDGMKRAGVVNPVFLLDEIDKLSSDYRGDPASALLEVLDSEQNKFFSDNYLEEPYDLSKVFFITTANYIENIPPALKDRLEIVELSSYTEFEKFEIAKRHLIDKQLELHGLAKADFEIEDEVIWKLIREYTMEAGVRELERLIGTLIRKAIKKILENKANGLSDSKVIVKADKLIDWIGKPRFTYNKIDVDDQVGIVTGLAYTQYGGDTLPIEATYFKGTGNITLTGKLGDVMKESAYAALSYVKAHAKDLHINEELFKENDLHIHVPEGAVPKDGPSAGVALATAIASLYSNRKVDHLLGMTGEITLRGKVVPIGGLREKSIAANRSGLKKILIPKDNVKDLEDVPESVLKELEIIPVSTINDVLSIALK